jgi:hypothetical protein
VSRGGRLDHLAAVLPDPARRAGAAHRRNRTAHPGRRWRGTPRLRDRTRAAGSRARAIAAKLRLRTAAGRDEAQTAVRRITGELAGLAEHAATEAEHLLANARRALRRATAHAAERAAAGVTDAAGLDDGRRFDDVAAGRFAVVTSTDPSAARRRTSISGAVYSWSPDPAASWTGGFVGDKDGQLPRLSTLSSYRLGVSPSRYGSEDQRGTDPYVRRNADDELDHALRNKPFVLVVGDSKAGKSRTAAEAARRLTLKGICPECGLPCLPGAARECSATSAGSGSRKTEW